MIQTSIWPVDPLVPQADVIEQAAQVIRQGGLVGFPTETVYGLGANALDAAAVRRIFEAKGRPSNDPLIVHVAEAAGIRQVGQQVPEIAWRLAQAFWPGPLTLVLPRAGHIPLEVTAGGETVAVRCPSHPVAQALIRAARTPVAAPSANLFSRPSPTEAAHVLADLDGRIDGLLDGGTCPIGVESSVVDLTQSPPRLLRPGGVAFEALRELIPDLILPETAAAVQEILHSPGMLLRHYAPRTPLLLITGAEADCARAASMLAGAFARHGTPVGLLLPQEELPGIAGVVEVSLGSRENLAEAARSLFAGLRHLDSLDLRAIITRSFPPVDLGLTLADRLRRAANGRSLSAEQILAAGEQINVEEMLDQFGRVELSP